MTLKELIDTLQEYLSPETQDLEVFFLRPMSGEPLPVSTAQPDYDDKMFILGEGE